MRRTGFAAVLAVVFALGAPVFSLAEPAVYKRAVLENGVRVVSQTAEGEVAAACIFIGVGTADETQDSCGITSLVNSIVLSCHPMAGKDPPVLVIERQGGVVDAVTTPDLTCFTLVAPVDNLGAALSALAGAVQRPRFAGAVFLTEKDALAARADGRSASLEELAYAAFLEKTYKGLPYGIDPAGDPKALAGLVLDDVVAWHERHYRPDNILVSICGGFTGDEAVESVAKAFKTAPAQGAADAAEPLPGGGRGGPVEAAGRYDEYAPAVQAAAVLGYTAPALGSDDYPAMKLAEALLAGGMGSMMYRALREDDELAYGFGSFLPQRRDVSRLALFVVSDEDKVGPAVDRMKAAVEALKEGGFGGDELERARRFALGGLSFTEETSRGRAYSDGLYELAGLGAGYGGAIARRLERLEKSDVTAAARNYMDDYTLVFLKPDVLKTR